MDKLNEISKALASIDDSKMIEKFLKSILTNSEVHELSTRWALVLLLDQGLTQRKIAKKLNLGLCKITRGSRELKKRHSAFKHMIDTFNRLKKLDLP